MTRRKKMEKKKLTKIKHDGFGFEEILIWKKLNSLEILKTQRKRLIRTVSL